MSNPATQNSNRPLSQGTHISGYVKAEVNKPPRQCDHCIWYRSDFCHHPIVKVDPEVAGVPGQPKPVGDEDCCNYFQSGQSVLLYCVRHGETELNANNSFRGWANVELDDKGREEAKSAGEFLKDKGISCIICSPLDRAQETAKIIAGIIGYNPDLILVMPGFLPWNVGLGEEGLSGKPKDAYKPVLEHLLDNPDTPAPGDGESVNGFGERFREALEWVVEEAKKLSGPVCTVFHTSNVVQTEHWADEKNTATRPEETDTVEPGGILAVMQEKDGYSTKPVHGIISEGEYGS